MMLIMTYLQLRQVVCMVKYQNIGYIDYIRDIYDDVSEIILRYRVCNKTHDQKFYREKQKAKQNKSFFCKQVVYIYIYIVCMIN